VAVKSKVSVEGSLRVPGWLVGLFTSTLALVVLSFVELGVFTSVPGLLIAGTLAFIAGMCAAATVDSRRLGPNAAIVAWYIAALLAVYLVLPALSRPLQPGGPTRGGPGVFPPQ
jgi:hypothetical protein